MIPLKIAVKLWYEAIYLWVCTWPTGVMTWSVLNQNFSLIFSTKEL